MIEPVDDLVQHRLQLRKSKQQPDVVELLALERQYYLVIVPMRLLTLPTIATQVVPGRKSIFYADFKHEAPSPPQGAGSIPNQMRWVCNQPF